MKGYDYLASPYTDPDPMVRELRYMKVMEVAATMLKNGVWVYSPILHCHRMSQIFNLPHDSAFWLEYDTAMIEGCRGIQVLRLEGWSRSVGVKGEIALAQRLGKNITFISGDLNAEAAVTIYPDIKQPPAA